MISLRLAYLWHRLDAVADAIPMRLLATLLRLGLLLIVFVGVWLPLWLFAFVLLAWTLIRTGVNEDELLRLRDTEQSSGAVVSGVPVGCDCLESGGFQPVALVEEAPGLYEGTCAWCGAVFVAGVERREVVR